MCVFCRFSESSEGFTIGEALANDMIDTKMWKSPSDSTTNFCIIDSVIDSRTCKIMSYTEAVEYDIILPSSKLYYDRFNFKHIPILDALQGGHIRHFKIDERSSFLQILKPRHTLVDNTSTFSYNNNHTFSVLDQDDKISITNHQFRSRKKKCGMNERFKSSTVTQTITTSTITGVWDSLTETVLSPQEAMKRGVFCDAKYVFRNIGTSIPLTDALGRGLVYLECGTFNMKHHTDRNVGLITVDTVRTCEEQEIQSCVDLIRDVKLMPAQAVQDGILDMTNKTFR